MRKILLFAALFIIRLFACAAEPVDTAICIVNNTNDTIRYMLADVDSIYADDEQNMLFVATKDGEKACMPMADILSLCFMELPKTTNEDEPGVKEDDGGTEAFNDVVYVTYNGNEASVSVLPSDGSITADISRADVTITNSITDREIVFVLSGNSNAGSFTYNGDYKTTIRLNGLTLKGTTEEALHIKDGKRIALELVDGTVNSLEDASTNGGQKGAFYTKGHLEVSGGGTLNLIGNIKHAISSKEYMLIKKTTGTINISKAAMDGIHAGQYFKMNGGNVNIKGTGCDGIQAEMTDDETDENNGQMMIYGGNLSIECAGDTIDCLKADALLTLAGGNITLSATGKGGKGIKAKKELVMGQETDGSGPVLSVTTTGDRLASNGTSTSGNNGGWGGRPGGNRPGGGETSSGSSAKAIKAEGAITIYGGTSGISTAKNGAEGMESKTSINILGGMHYFKCYDDCINSKGNIYFNGGVTVCYSNGNDAVDSNAGRAGAITIGNGTIFAYTSKGSPEEGLDCDNNSYIQITGNGIAISAGGTQGGGGSSSTISNARQGYYFHTSTISYTSGRYYTIADSQGNNLVTYSFPCSISSSLNLWTATGMTKGSTYNIKYSNAEPTDAITSFHGLYLGSKAVGSSNVTSFNAK